MEQRVLVLDGAMGTMLQQAHLTAADFGGAALEGCNDNLVRTRPDVVLDIHRKYFAAGSDIVETNTFGSTPLVLGEMDCPLGSRGSGPKGSGNYNGGGWCEARAAAICEFDGANDQRR